VAISHLPPAVKKNTGGPGGSTVSVGKAFDGRDPGARGVRPVAPAPVPALPMRRVGGPACCLDVLQHGRQRVLSTIALGCHCLDLVDKLENEHCSVD